MFRLDNRVFLWLCLLVLPGCNPSKNNREIPVIKVETKSDKISLSDVADEIRFVPLETNDSCLIGEVNKLLIYNDKLIVFDRVHASTIFIFNKEGRFLSKISNCGKGPLEYVAITDLTIDIKNEQILIYDNKSKRLIWFEFDGKPVKSKYVGIVTNEISCDAEGMVLFYSPFNPNAITENNKPVILPPGLIVFNPENGSFRMGLIDGSEKSVVAYSPGLSGFGKSLYLCSQFSDTIYFGKNREIEPMCFLDFGEFSVPGNQRKRNYSRSNSSVFFNSRFVTGKHFFMASDDWIFFCHTMQKSCIYNFIHRQVNSTISGTTIKNDLTGTSFSFPLFIDNEGLYALANFDNFKPVNTNFSQIKDESSRNCIKDTVESILASLDEGSNPVLVQIKLK